MCRFSIVTESSYLYFDFNSVYQLRDYNLYVDKSKYFTTCIFTVRIIFLQLVLIEWTQSNFAGVSEALQNQESGGSKIKRTYV